MAGYVRCQHCNALLSENEVKDLQKWISEETIAIVFTCPKCKKETYREL
jgi:phage FluMu protein Com